MFDGMKRVVILSAIPILLLRLPVTAQDAASTPASTPASTAAAIAAREEVQAGGMRPQTIEARISVTSTRFNINQNYCSLESLADRRNLRM